MFPLCPALYECRFNRPLPNVSFSWKTVKFNSTVSISVQWKLGTLTLLKQFAQALFVFVIVLRAHRFQVTFVALPRRHCNNKLVYRLFRAQRVMAFFVSVYFVTLIPAGLFFFYFRETLTWGCWHFCLSCQSLCSRVRGGSSDIDIISRSSVRLPPLAGRWSAY